MGRHGHGLRQRGKHTDAMPARQVHDDLAAMHIRGDEVDNLRQGIVGNRQDEEVAGSRHFARVHDGNARE